VRDFEKRLAKVDEESSRAMASLILQSTPKEMASKVAQLERWALHLSENGGKESCILN